MWALVGPSWFNVQHLSGIGKSEPYVNPAGFKNAKTICCEGSDVQLSKSNLMFMSDFIQHETKVKGPHFSLSLCT